MDKIKEINRGFQYIENTLRKLEMKKINESGLDITRRALIYIVSVHDNENETMTEILGATGVTKATLSNQLKVIVAKGYAELYIDKYDSRKKRIKLTEKGKRAYELHVEIREEIRNEYRKVLTEREINSLISIGRKIKDQIRSKSNE